MAEAKQTKEQKADLKAAQAAAPSEDELISMARRVPPLARDEDHSFVPAEDTQLTEAPFDDPELVTPDLTNQTIGEATAAFGEEEGSTLTITRPDRAESEYDINTTRLTETDIERMSDEQIKDSGLLKKSVGLIHPSRIAPSSTQLRAPTDGSPAAGTGSWPVNESQMPAVLPSDPPLEEADDRHDGHNGFAKAAGFNRHKDGTLRRKGLKIKGNEVRHAASLFLRLRQQFPQFTSEQLSDEFELQWLSGRAGAPQSHRPGGEASPHGLTAAGDDRVAPGNLGAQRAESERAFEADAAPGPIPPEARPEAGVPSENEPASTAVDQAKESSGETAEADQQAVKDAAKLENKPDDNK